MFVVKLAHVPGCIDAARLPNAVLAPEATLEWKSVKADRLNVIAIASFTNLKWDLLNAI